MDKHYPEQFLNHPILLMLAILRTGRRRGLHMFGPQPLHLPHYAILSLLKSNGPLSQKEVSERLFFDPSEIVAYIDALEHEGYVVRERDSQDRRRYRLIITPQGRAALKSSDTRTEVFMDDFFEPLTPAERRQFMAILRKLLR